MKKPIRRAILDGAAQIAVPAFVSTLAICIVFVPVVFLTGPAAYLFTPLALAVVFAMLASYLLSRTLVPTMVLYLLPPEVEPVRRRRTQWRGIDTAAGRSGGSTMAFNRQFERLRLGLPGAARLGAGSSRLRRWPACSASPWARWLLFPRIGQTSSPPSTPASSGCTSGRRPARASRRRSGSSARSRTSSARSCPTASGR